MIKKSNPVPFDREHMKEFFRIHWGKIDDAEAIGISIGDLISISDEKNSYIETPFLDLWIDIHEAMTIWMIAIFTSMYHSKRERKNKSPLEYAVTCLSSRIISDAIAIRRLVEMGFDTSARAILRSTAEHMDLLAIIFHDPALSIEFLKTGNPKGAKEFWNKHIARGGMHKKLEAALLEYFGGDSELVEAYLVSQKEPFDMLSSVTHSSRFGVEATLGLDRITKIEDSWFWSQKSDDSIETLYLFTRFIFPILILSKDFPFSGYDDFLAGPILVNENSKLSRLIREGRLILLSVTVNSHREENREKFYP